MPVFRLDERLIFPPPELAQDGLLAVGGDLRPERLILAYSSGIFPWYSEGQPILWHSPDPRFVLVASRVRIGKTLRKTLRKRSFDVSLDTGFGEVMSACAEAPRPGQEGTWITREMLEAYCELHRLGLAHSVEVRRGGALVGGLYGVALGGVFFGESMFAREGEASKVALVTLVEQLRRWGIGLIDSQVHTAHLERFGAEHWPRRRYLRVLRTAMRRPTRKGNWVLDPDLLRGVLPGAPPTGETEAGMV